MKTVRFRSIALAGLILLAASVGDALGYVGPGAGAGGSSIGIGTILVIILVGGVALCVVGGLIAAVVAAFQRLRLRARIRH